MKQQVPRCTELHKEEKMTAIIETFRKIGWSGDLKIISIQTTAAAATGFTIDFNSDVTDGKGMVFEELLNMIVQDDAGLSTITDSSFDPATGIFTLGTVSTGIHNLTFIGY